MTGEYSPPADEPMRVVVLLSGNGSNLQAIIDASRRPGFPARVCGVISNKPDAYGLERAARESIPTAVVNHRDYPERPLYDARLAEIIDNFRPDLVVLAGFMRILTAEFVHRYQGRMLNIHPSLLPKFRGLNTHQRAIEAGETEHGASVHFVTPELDGGPVILQARIPILPQEDAAHLANRIHHIEHRIYPAVVRLFAEKRLELNGEHVVLDGQILERPLDYHADKIDTMDQ